MQPRHWSRCRTIESSQRLALEPLLHEVDAAAGAVHLLAPQHVRRAGGQAEAAVHAVADQCRVRRVVVVEGRRQRRADARQPERRPAGRRCARGRVLGAQPRRPARGRAAAGRRPPRPPPVVPARRPRSATGRRRPGAHRSAPREALGRPDRASPRPCAWRHLVIYSPPTKRPGDIRRSGSNWSLTRRISSSESPTGPQWSRSRTAGRRRSTTAVPSWRASAGAQPGSAVGARRRRAARRRRRPVQADAADGRAPAGRRPAPRTDRAGT